VLLDECIDWRLAREFTGHFVRTVPQMGWKSIKNGRLLRLAEAKFDVFVTVDRNLSFQHPLPKFGIAVAVLRAKTNRLADLIPPAKRMLAELPTLQPGQVREFSS